MTIILDGTLGITTPRDVEIQGTTSGSIILAAPAVAGSNTQTLVAATGTLAPIVSGTAVASTSGTSIDFTGIPAYVKRITVMFSGVSTNGTSLIQLQLGSGSIVTTGYSGYYAFISTSTVNGQSSTTGFQFNSNSGANNLAGSVVLTNLSGNVWTASLNVGSPGAGTTNVGGGTITLSGVLDRLRITTVNGTDTFDAGSINILWE